ncbi:RICIN domain-containing protein [Streptomyces sp. AS13]|uniref:RICIN domain-containing protein n=1 Tax=Streptomyces sp. AS13 TaxID=3038080 RepID=UPI00278C2788|nr:RICIN domain-containing protein [Streptomyces sp. AS13]
MAREHDPTPRIPTRSGTSSGEGGTGNSRGSGGSSVSVRRAVTMPGAPGDPGSALAPGGGTTAPDAGAAPEAATRAETPVSGKPAGTNAGAAASTSATTGPDAASTGARAEEPREEAESTTEPSASSAAAAASVPASSASSAASAPTAELATVSTDGPASGSAATATGTGGDGGASTQEGDEPPGSRPKKPMLAAAGIVGALLIAVPFLLAGQDDRKPERTRTENVAGTVLDSERPPVPETYTSQTPTAAPTPSKKKEEKKEKKAVAPVVHQPPVTVSPTPSPEKSKAEEKPKPKVKAKVKAKALTPAEQLRQWANGRSGVQNTVIKNASTNQCIDIGGYGKGKINNAVNQYPCNGTTGDNQLWNLDIVDKDGGPQNAPLFLIRNSKDGLCLDLGYYNARSAGTKIGQFHCNASGDNQLWWLDPRGDGTNWIRNAVSKDLCLRPTGGVSAGNDARLEIANCGFGDRWIV